MSPIVAALLAAVLAGREPPPDAPALAEAAERAVAQLGPLRGQDEASTLALMLVTADEESGFRMTPPGSNDGGRAHCAMQVWGTADVSTPESCMLEALRNLRESQRMCPDELAAQYAGGCDRPAARRISARRRRRAAELVRQVGE